MRDNFDDSTEAGRAARQDDHVADSKQQAVLEMYNSQAQLRAVLDSVPDGMRAEEALRRKTETIELLQLVAAASNQARTPEEALQFCLDAFCAYSGWPVGHVYMPSEEDRLGLAPTGLWHFDDPKTFETFRRVTEKTRFPIGIGLPGRVLASKKPAWIADVTQDEGFLRAKLADNIGVIAGFAFPVLVGEEVVAVLEFFTPNTMQPDEALVNVLTHVGTQVGRVIERWRATKQLAEARRVADEANRAKSDFLANVSHEIRTPLTAVLGYTDILIEENWEREPTLKKLEIIKRNGTHLLEVINDILDLSKIESGRLSVEKAKCSPLMLIAEIESTAKIRADEQDLTFQIDFTGPIPETIFTDPTRLRQILINLIGNAVKFTRIGSVKLLTQLVTADDGQPMLQFDVIDTGVGMTEEELHKLFQPFTQADTSATRQFGGTGLGLVISKRFAEMLGGDISVSSEQGKGSTFTVKIVVGPLDGVSMIFDPHAAISTRPRTQHPPKKATSLLLENCTVLLAEDGPDNQRLISLMLKRAGANVTVVGNGELAVRQAVDAWERGRPFDVIFMDMQMPVLDGYDATRILRDKGYDRPIVALTAHAMSHDRRKCLDAGCDDFQPKPIDHQKLIAITAEYAKQRPDVTIRA